MKRTALRKIVLSQDRFSAHSRMPFASTENASPVQIGQPHVLGSCAVSGSTFGMTKPPERLKQTHRSGMQNVPLKKSPFLRAFVKLSNYSCNLKREKKRCTSARKLAPAQIKQQEC